ncbi:MAG: hypothetical protein F8N36_15945 [Desulfovibrio sp.]|uniref:TrbI/VirB10 family protein n=1 Tax=Desulfovibrio sp. TaxID=885 RepID=UPI00135D589B|nr:TrbI/VirB10 family protein [Desulfovibrio sp.]MTJ94331.1 hypothetical protein [Desulfovibrio sp.]
MKLPKFYTDLPPRTRKFILIGVSVAALFGTNQLLQQAAPTARQKKNTVDTVFTDNDTRALSLGAMMAEIKKLQASVKDLNTANDKMRGELKEQGFQSQVERDKRINELGGRIDSLENGIKNFDHKTVQTVAGASGTAPAGATPPQATKAGLGSSEEPHPKASSFEVSPDEAFLGVATPGKPAAATGIADMRTNPVSPGEVQVATIKTVAENKSATSAVKSTKALVKRPISMGISSATLVTGMAVPTGQGGRQDPFPALLRIKKETLLPNMYRADLRECFALMSAYGDLSSERAILRGEKISCIDKQGRMLEGRLQGYATGEDGQVGVAGHLVSKQGQLIGKAILAGVAQGIGGAFNFQQTPTLALSTGGSTTNPAYTRAFSAESLQAGAAGGVGNAMQMLAQWYIAQANAIFPVIEISPGRSIDIIMTSPTVLTEVDGSKASGPTLSGSENGFFNGGTGISTRQNANMGMNNMLGMNRGMIGANNNQMMGYQYNGQ